LTPGAAVKAGAPMPRRRSRWPGTARAARWARTAGWT